MPIFLAFSHSENFKVLYPKIDAQNHKYALVNNEQIFFQSQMFTTNVAMVKKVIVNGWGLSIFDDRCKHCSIIQGDNK